MKSKVFTIEMLRQTMKLNSAVNVWVIFTDLNKVKKQINSSLFNKMSEAGAPTHRSTIA